MIRRPLPAVEGDVAAFTQVFSYWPMDSSFLFRPPILYILHHSFERIIVLQLRTYLIQPLVRGR